MRVLLWFETFWPLIGGVQVLGRELARELVARGHEVTVVARRDDATLAAEERSDGISIYRYPFIGTLQSRDLPNVTRLAAQVASLLRLVKPDIVHLYQSGPSSYFFRTPVESRTVPAVVTLHQAHPDRFVRPQSLRGQLLRSACWVTACSRDVLDATLLQIPELAHRSSVVLNSLPMPDVAHIPIRLQPPRLLCIGRCVTDKGFDIAVAAMKQITACFPNATLLIAGDGPEIESLRQLARTLDVPVECAGWVQPVDVPALIANSTLVMMPSRTEPFGLVALQAAQMGRPIVATRAGGLPEIIEHGETGLLVEPDNPDALAAAVLRLLQSPELAHVMGAAARRRAERDFDWNRHVDAYEELYSCTQTQRLRA